MDDKPQDNKQIKVFLLDDHEIVRRGVRDLLEAEPDITVIGEAGTASVGAGQDPGAAARRGRARRTAARWRRRQRVPGHQVQDA